MNDIFESSKLRLSRAKEHIDTFEERVKIFQREKEWTHASETDPNGVDIYLKVVFTKPFPNDFTTIAIEVIEHLRAALDQAGYAVAIASGIVNPKKAYFPFAKDEAGLQALIRERCKNIPPDILTLFCSFKPYKGGNNLLWELNRVCNANKHRRNKLIGIVPGLIVNSKFMAYGGPATVPQLEWNRRKNEIVYLIIGPTTLIEPNMDITINIAFEEIIGGNTALAVLNDMASIVESILLATEAEARRLGLIT